MAGADTSALASGPGWRVRRLVCTAGPADRPFEEQHESACVAAVLGGTFKYRSAEGTAMLSPGAVLLGNPGTCFECSHEHSAGDLCVAFHFAPEYLESVLDGQSGRGRGRVAFAGPRLPPSPALIALLANIEHASTEVDAAELEEAGLRLAAAALRGGPERPGPSASSPRDDRRVAELVRVIEQRSDEKLSLAGLAAQAGISPYRLLRSFQRSVGMTPHQYVLRTRLHRAALRIRQTDLPIATIAFDAGFGDLSTFNRRFRRVLGVSPRAYRGQE